MKLEARSRLYRLCAAAALLALAIWGNRSALADEIPADPVARCRGLPGLLLPSEFRDSVKIGDVTPIGAEGCRFSDLRLTASKYLGWSVGSVTVEHVDFKGAYANGRPLSLAAHAEGVLRVLQSGNAPSDYQFKLLQHPMQLSLAYGADRAARTFTLSDLGVRGERVGRLAVTAELDDFDQAALEGDPQDIPSALRLVKLGRFTLQLDNRGLIEVYALLPALLALPGGHDDPEGAIRNAKLEAVAALGSLKSAIAAPSLQALRTFIEDLPQPQRPLTLICAPTAPVSLAAIAQTGGRGPAFNELVKALNITALY